MSPFGNTLACLGAVGGLVLPVATAWARAASSALADGPTAAVPDGGERAFAVAGAVRFAVHVSGGPPEFADGTPRVFTVPGAVRFAVHVCGAVRAFVDGAPRSGADFEVAGPAFALALPGGVRADVRARIPADGGGGGDADLAWAALTPAEDAALFAAAATAVRTGAGECPEAAAARLAPALAPAAARARLNLHRALIGDADVCPDAEGARWLAPVHALPVHASAGAFDAADGDGARFFAAAARGFAIAPIDRGPFPKTIANRERPRVALRSFWGALFASAPGGAGAWLPRADADAEALVGAGRWIAWIWRTGKRLPFPLSRVAIRVAFGGEVRSDDVADADPEFAGKRPSKAEIVDWMAPIEGALAAFRAGVVAAGVVVDDDPIMPRVFQLRPFSKAHGVEKVAGAFESPIVRNAVWEEQCRVRGPESPPPPTVDQIIARFE
jgi:hypothetical protein